MLNKTKIALLLIMVFTLPACVLTETSEDVYRQSIKEAGDYYGVSIEHPPPLIFISCEAFSKLAKKGLTRLEKDAVAAHIVFNSGGCMIIMINEYKNTRYEKPLYDHEIAHHVYHCVRGLEGDSELFARKYSEEYYE